MEFIFPISIILISSMLLTTKSPIMMGIYIFLQAFLIALLISSMSLSTWMSYLLFIICLGGILIVFLFVIMSLTVGMDPGSKLPVFFMILLFLPFYKMEELKNSSETNPFSVMIYEKLQETVWLMKITSLTQMKFSISLMIILFLTMVIVVNLTKKKSSMLKI